MSFVYLLDIEYNLTTNKIEFRTFLSNTTIFPVNLYKPGEEGTDQIPTVFIGTFSPYFIIPQSLSNAFGIDAGIYPISCRTPDPTQATNQSAVFNNSGGAVTMVVSSSSFTPGLNPPPFLTSYYKPNNPQFAQQGAVTASSLITRVKYNNITSNSLKYQSVLGSTVANAMAYSGDLSMPYTLKSKMGYPQSNTPVFTSTGFTSVANTCVRVRR